MSNINIRRDVSDKFYRYKMPRLISKVEGKGNGIKTVIPNMTEIAKALGRQPMYPTKFFGCELGAQVKLDVANDRHIVNGAHDAEKLQSLLDGFIDKFVLCPSCKNPETELVITKDETIIRDCKACGAHLPVDMRHKLVTYILKNPPESAKKAGASGTSKSDRRGKKAAAAAAAAAAGPGRSASDPNIPTPPETNSRASGDDDGGDDADDELTRKIEQEAALLPISNRDGDDEDWAEDTNEDAVAARMRELNVSGAVSKLLEEGDDDGDNDGDDPIEQFADYVTANPAATDDEIVNKASELGVRDHKAAAVLAQLLFNADILAEKQVAQRAPLLQRFVKNEKAQKAILGGIERLVGVNHPELITKVAILLKEVYDTDIVDEEVFLAWGAKASKKYVDKKLSKEIRVHAEPFLNWLREAEEDGDEEDDE